MWKKKKKGSTLLTVVVIFAVLATLGAAMLTLTGTDYNLRIKESKRVQNMYGSDSGIDNVYAHVRAVVKNGIDAGNASAANTMTTLQTRYAGSQFDSATMKTSLSQSFTTAYTQYVQNNIAAALADNAEFSGTITTSTDGLFHNNEMNVTIRSVFSSTAGDNIRKVSALLKIGVPDYVNPYSFSTLTAILPNDNLWDNSIAIDGNMNIQSNFTVKDQMFVKGTTSTGYTDVVYDKYNNGIAITGNGVHVNFDNIITPSNFSINASNVNVTCGNVYSKNFYIGKASASAAAINNDTLNITNSLYTNNDLALNANATTMTIGNYYGINELHYDPQSSDYNANRSYEEASDSSSIIVNSDDLGSTNGSSINILHDAYIMGVGYIKNMDTQNPDKAYRTGESVAVKGNYVGYGVIDSQHQNNLTEQQRTDNQSLLNAIHTLFDGLFLVNKFSDNSSITAYDKSKYISLFDSLYGSDGHLVKSGIRLASQGGTIKSAGAYIDSVNNKIQVNNYHIEDTTPDDDLSTKRNNYGYNALKMNINLPADATLSQNDISYNTIRKVVMNTDNVNQTAMVKFAKTINNSNVNLDNVELTDNNYNIRVFNSDSSRTVKIIGDTMDTVPPNANDIVIRVPYSDTVPSQGLIVTKGNVEVYGRINFSGLILAGGNFIDQDGLAKTFAKNRQYVANLMVNNPDYLQYFNTEGMTTSTNSVFNGINATNNLQAYDQIGTKLKLAQWKLEQ